MKYFCRTPHLLTCLLVVFNLHAAAYLPPVVKQTKDTLLVADTNIVFKSIPSITKYISSKARSLDALFPPGKSDGFFRTKKQTEFSDAQAILIAKLLEKDASQRIQENVFQLAGLAHQNLPESRILGILKLFPATCQNSGTAKAVLARLDKYRMTNNSIKGFLDKRYYNASGNLNKLVSDDQRDKLVIFWASWCSPCRAESKELMIHYAQLDTLRIEVISLSLDEKITAWKKALNTDKYPWRNLVDTEGFRNEIAKHLNIRTIPTSILADPKGNIKVSNPTVEYIIENFKQRPVKNG